MWGDSKFRGLSPLQPSGRALFVYLLSGPHTSSIPGLFDAGRARLAEELEWTLEAFDRAFEEVFRQGLAKADFSSRLVWIPGAIEYNLPESPNVVTSWSDAWRVLPECDLKHEAYVVLATAVMRRGEAFAKAFAKAIDDPFAKPCDKAATYGGDKACNMPLVYQEQEQEQEQEPINGATASQLNSTILPHAFSEANKCEAAFEIVWATLPRRAGSNPKRDAYLRYQARLAEGADPAAILAGAVRYAAFIRATGKERTEHVLQGVTFLGPAKRYEEPFDLPAEAVSSASKPSCLNPGPQLYGAL